MPQQFRAPGADQPGNAQDFTSAHSKLTLRGSSNRSGCSRVRIGSPGVCGTVGNRSLTLRPTISETIAASLAPDRFPVPTVFPSRSTVYRWATRRISSRK